MDRAWLINSRGLAKIVKNAGLPFSSQIEDCEANLECPKCQYIIDNSNVCHDWPGFPAGVKFDPSDIELLEHLAAKCGTSDLQPHIFIDEFIPTVEEDEGICYTHPENLPGAKKDGSSVHFFYKITKAYTKGKRKRRKIQDPENAIKTNVRWHKTGKTKPVTQNGIHKGFKKIMVLYATSKRGSKPDKCNWIMHQYHIGTNEDEREGEFVVSKIFYQPQKESEKNESFLVIEECDMKIVQVIPRTPKTNTPRQEKTPLSDCGSDDYYMQLQEMENFNAQFDAPSGYLLEGKTEYDPYLVGENRAFDSSGLDSLLSNEINDSYVPSNNVSSSQIGDLHPRNGNDDASCRIEDLDNIDFDTPPHFHLDDLQFASQDSVFDGLIDDSK